MMPIIGKIYTCINTDGANEFGQLPYFCKGMEFKILRVIEPGVVYRSAIPIVRTYYQCEGDFEGYTYDNWYLLKENLNIKNIEDYYDKTI